MVRFRCGGTTQRGTSCRNPVKEAGLRCRHHPSWSAVQTRPRRSTARTPAAPRPRTASSAPRRSTSPPPSREELLRVRSAAESCIGLIASSSPQEVVIGRATEYVSDEMWQRLTRSWSGRRCSALAKLARTILDAQDRLREGLVEVTDRTLKLLNRSSVERQFAAELVKRLPLPAVGENLIATARGLQVTGIVVCVAESRPLTECACFTDVVCVEGQAKVKSLITAGMADWAGLGTIDAR